MNLEDLPVPVREDIEEQSLGILEKIKDDIVVIGGWGVRAHLGEEHRRHTLDVDGVTDEGKLGDLEARLGTLGLDASPAEWGIRFFKPYTPGVPVPEGAEDAVAAIQLRIEVSGPRIQERDTHHYFEFSLTEFVGRKIRYRGRDGAVEVKVPPLEHLTAVKLGLPVDYKNNHDAAMLLRSSNVDEVLRVILANDDWAGLVLRRMPKLKGRISQSGSIENILALAAGLDVRGHVRMLEELEARLR